MWFFLWLDLTTLLTMRKKLHFGRVKRFVFSLKPIATAVAANQHLVFFYADRDGAQQTKQLFILRNRLVRRYGVTLGCLGWIELTLLSNFSLTRAKAVISIV